MGESENREKVGPAKSILLFSRASWSNNIFFQCPGREKKKKKENVYFLIMLSDSDTVGN